MTRLSTRINDRPAPIIFPDFCGVEVYQSVLTLTHRQRSNAAMPTCVGMAGNGGRYVNHYAV